MQRSRNTFLLVVIVGAGIGLLFAAVSTYDFAQHLDRQIHSLHCSFVPGLATPDVGGTSGCHTAMMSPFSSVFSGWIWGGVPVSLAAMGMFAFLIFLSAALWLEKRDSDPRANGLLALATLVPALASVVMAGIALVMLDAACKVCIGIYVGSAVTLVGGIGAWRRARYEGLQALVAKDSVGSLRSWVTKGWLMLMIGAAAVLVGVPALAYVAAAPAHDEQIAACGVLERPDDWYGVMVPVGTHSGGVPTIEVLDPLCPACRALDRRIEASGLDDQLERRLLLFPLESRCNWMVDSTIHPGACTVSEALLCASSRLEEVLAWTFANQEEIRERSAENPSAARTMFLEAFPQLRGCLGSASVKAKLNKSMRWAVRNRLRLLTPQLFVAGVRVCEEDTDLGLDYALAYLLEQHAANALPKPPPRWKAPQLAAEVSPPDESGVGEEQESGAALADESGVDEEQESGVALADEAGVGEDQGSGAALADEAGEGGGDVASDEAAGDTRREVSGSDASATETDRAANGEARPGAEARAREAGASAPPQEPKSDSDDGRAPPSSDTSDAPETSDAPVDKEPSEDPGGSANEDSPKRGGTP